MLMSKCRTGDYLSYIKPRVALALGELGKSKKTTVSFRVGLCIFGISENCGNRKTPGVTPKPGEMRLVGCGSNEGFTVSEKEENF